MVCIRIRVCVIVATSAGTPVTALAYEGVVGNKESRNYSDTTRDRRMRITNFIDTTMSDDGVVGGLKGGPSVVALWSGRLRSDVL